MGYHLKSGEAPEDAVRRLTQEQIERTISEIESEDANLCDLVHQVRRRFKKIRGLLRLIRDSVGEVAYRRENCRFRHLGRVFAPLRDAQVRVQTFDELQRRFPAVLRQPALADLRRRLESDREATRRGLMDRADVLDKVCFDLREASERVREWRLEGDGFSIFAPGLRRVYRRGRKRFRRSLANPSPGHFHEWRKQTRYLWCHLKILRPCWSPVLLAWAGSCSKLIGQLGESHDLSSLCSYILGAGVGRERTREELVRLADRRQAALCRPLFALGARIYAERPGDYVERLHAYWLAWSERG